MEPNRPNILYTASGDGHLRSFHLPYLRALTEAGCAVTAAAAGDGHGLPPGVRFLPLPFEKRLASPQNFCAALRLAALIRRERFACILTHTSLAAFFTRLAVLAAGKGDARVVNTVHGYLFDADSPPGTRRLLLAAERLTAGVTDDILTMNRADTELARARRLCRGRVVPIDGMGAELASFVPAAPEQRAEARRRFGIPAEAFTLVCAAEFSPRKNQRLLIEALPALPGCSLLLPGQGALREDCRRLAQRLGVAGRVSLPGYLPDTRPALYAADLCVSAARSEGLPFHLLEAMSCGLPLLVSRVKGNADLVEAGRCGALYPFGDRAAFAAAVLALKEAPQDLAALGRRGREASARYELSRVLPAVLPFYLPEGIPPLT